MIIAYILLILVGIELLLALPYIFGRLNNRREAQSIYEEYIRDMVQCDQQNQAHSRELSKKLNIVNYWLKNGEDPAIEDAEDRDAQEQIADSENDDPSEAKERIENAERKRADKKSYAKIARINRQSEFTISNLDPCDVEQTEITFYYFTDPADEIRYCVTPTALENKFYNNVIYFTTCRPSQLPLVYPFKYEGAQMLSIYKHPSQAIWFLKNWKKIRSGLEGSAAPTEIVTELDESIKHFSL